MPTDRAHIYRELDCTAFQKLRAKDGGKFTVPVIKPGIFWWEHLTPEEKTFLDSLSSDQRLSLNSSANPIAELNDFK
jgi:hypothetical protein